MQCKHDRKTDERHGRLHTRERNRWKSIPLATLQGWPGVGQDPIS